MKVIFIREVSALVRRTVSLPDAVDQQVRDVAGDDEPFSAAVTRLLEAGLRATTGEHRPEWVGSGEGPDDLGRRAEDYLRDPVDGK